MMGKGIPYKRLLIKSSGHAGITEIHNKCQKLLQHKEHYIAIKG